MRILGAIAFAFLATTSSAMAQGCLYFPPSQMPPGVVGVPYSQPLHGFFAVFLLVFFHLVRGGGTFPRRPRAFEHGCDCGYAYRRGVFVFTIQVQDSVGNAASATFPMTVMLTAPPSITTASSLPSASLGAAYSQTFAATGGSPPYSWSVTSGALPAGLSLSSGGAITGTPTAAGTFNFTVQVLDSAGAFSTAQFSLGRTHGVMHLYPIPEWTVLRNSRADRDDRAHDVRGMPWTATSSLSWVTVTGGSSGTGSGSVTYQVAANTEGPAIRRDDSRRGRFFYRAAGERDRHRPGFRRLHGADRVGRRVGTPR